jgi:tetratricopeptide (TPR) repeat protein
MSHHHLLFLRRAGVPALTLAAALCGCASSQEFVRPEPPRYNLAEQVNKAKDLAARAQEAESGKRPDEAIALYRQAIETYRDFPAAWHNMALLQLQKGETLAAVDSFKVAGDLDLRDPRPVFNIGVIYEQQGWSAEAQRYYTEALARDANYLEALRRSVYLDMIQSTYTPVTLDRTRRALLLEQDDKWRGFFDRAQLRLNSVLTEGTATPLPTAPPAPSPTFPSGSLPGSTAPTGPDGVPPGEGINGGDSSVPSWRM